MDVMKQKPFKFTEHDFAHLDEETRDAVKRIVFRVDFQKAVAKLRDKHRITQPVKFDRAKLPPDIRAMRGHPEIRKEYEPHRPEDWMDVQHCELNEDFDMDVMQEVHNLGKADDGLWPLILHCYTKFWLLPLVDAKPWVNEINDPRTRTLLATVGVTAPDDLKNLQTLYQKADALITEGKEQKAKKLLERHEWTFIHSDSIQARSDHGDIAITISNNAPAALIKKVIAAMKPYRTYFHNKKYGKRNIPLEVYSMAADLRRAGVPPAKICSELRDKYRYSTNTKALPKLIERATKELGF